MRNLKLSVANTRLAKTWTNREISWEALKQRLSTTQKTVESLEEFLAMKKGEQDDIKDVGGFVGGLVKGVGLSGVESPEGDYKDNAPAKIRNLRKFFSDHGYNDLPRTARDFIDYLYSVGLNGTDSRTIPEITPLEIAKDVLEVMFGEDGLVIDKAGK